MHAFLLILQKKCEGIVIAYVTVAASRVWQSWIHYSLVPYFKMLNSGL